MGRIQFDWRWIALILFVALLVNANRLPWQIVALVLGGVGAYVLVLGWRAWTHTGGSSSRSRVTYWRGQRIETAPPRRASALPRLGDIGPAIIYFLLGGVLVLAALVVVLQQLGL